MRIPERLRTGASYVARCGKLCRGQRGVAVRAVEIGEATARADGVDVPLSEDRAQPSLERASPVKITEQRAAVGALSYPLKIRREGTRPLAPRRPGPRGAPQKNPPRPAVTPQTHQH